MKFAWMTQTLLWQSLQAIRKPAYQTKTREGLCFQQGLFFARNRNKKSRPFEVGFSRLKPLILFYRDLHRSTHLFPIALMKAIGKLKGECVLTGLQIKICRGLSATIVNMLLICRDNISL